ncbi:transcription termination factor 4, mitochondrial [Engraulis encrasicolus]|uniref:transcription termination factor 4, mitochondrial n=1 Tax=Engraulis encrasicolus TaxID=184585 RepID=UPI002FD3B0D8
MQAVRRSLRGSTCLALRCACSAQQNIWQFPLVSRMHCSRVQDSKVPTQPHERELSSRSLLDLGFTETQAETVCEGVIKALGKRSDTCDISTIKALLVLGLNSSSIVKILDKSPGLYKEKGPVVEKRIQNLSKLGLVEGNIQRVVSHYPQILGIPAKNVNAVVQFLKTKCLFTSQQVREILRDSPQVVEENLNDVDYKFQYAYFRMGVKQPDMVKARLFKVDIEELRCRHCFLERRGFYQTPDKKGQTLVLNPKLKDFLAVPEDVYLEKFAKARKAELDVFRTLLAREDRDEGIKEEHWPIEEGVEGIEAEEDVIDLQRGDMGSSGYERRKRK